MARSRGESHATTGFPLRAATFTRGMSRTRIGEALCYLVSGVATTRREGAEHLARRPRKREIGNSGWWWWRKAVPTSPQNPEPEGRAAGWSHPLAPSLSPLFCADGRRRGIWSQVSALTSKLVMTAKVSDYCENVKIIWSRSSSKSPIVIHSKPM